LKLPALRADVPAPTAVKTPVLYPASSFVLGSFPKTAENVCTNACSGVFTLPRYKNRTQAITAANSG